MKTKVNKKEKDFDAVKTMREIRDQFSKEIMNMSFAEEKAYLKKMLKRKGTSSKADYTAGVKAEIILVSEKFVPWEKVKKGLKKKPTSD